MDGLPGEELITKGLADLARGEETVESLLVSIGGPKLRSLAPPLDRARLQTFLEELSHAAREPTRLYLFDAYTQVLSKLERGHDRDRRDVAALVEARLVDPVRLRALFDEAETELFRYPAADPRSLRRAVDTLAGPGPV